MLTQSFHITGLHCQSCEAITKNTFHELGNVTISDIQVSAREGRVAISYEGTLDVERVRNELAEIGYILDIIPVV